MDTGHPRPEETGGGTKKKNARIRAAQKEAARLTEAMVKLSSDMEETARTYGKTDLFTFQAKCVYLGCRADSLSQKLSETLKILEGTEDPAGSAAVSIQLIRQNLLVLSGMRETLLGLQAHAKETDKARRLIRQMEETKRIAGIQKECKDMLRQEGG